MREITHTLLSQLYAVFPLAFSEKQLCDILWVRGYRLPFDQLHGALASLLKTYQVEMAPGEGPPRYRLRPTEEDWTEGPSE